MTSPLRAVLQRFEDQSAPISVQQMARDLDLEPGVLLDMIEYWVRKGKLRAVSGTGSACTTCGSHGACPFVVTLPRTFELASDDIPTVPPCGDACCVK